jgi:hypothetical protein
MRMTRLPSILGTTALLATLAACGGGSDGPPPTGGALANVWFADSEGYHPLDKVRPDGSFYNGTEADLRQPLTRNCARIGRIRRRLGGRGALYNRHFHLLRAPGSPET